MTALPVVVRLGDRELYRALPKQAELHHSKEPYVLFGGSAGPGKSMALRWHGIMACLKYPNLRVLLLRRQSTELETTHLLALRTELPKEVATLRQGPPAWLEFPNGAVIRFGHCNTDADFASHLSSEWELILIDEAGQFTPYMLTMFPSRLRTTKGLRTQLLLASNPGGPSHQYLKDRFVDKTGPRDGSAYRPEEYRFIPTTVYDNPHIDAAYVGKLEALPEPERSMYLLGTWDIPAGALFQELLVGVHLVPPRVRQPHYRRVAVADWGRSNIAPAVWFEVNEGVGAIHAHAYQEWIPSDIPPERWAQGLLERSGYDLERREWKPDAAPIEKVILDASAFDPQQNFGPSPAEQMIATFRQAHVRLVESIKGPDSVRDGVTLLHSWFDTYGGQVAPCLTVSQACPESWAALTTIQRGDAAKGDAGIPKRDQHPLVDILDCFRYFVQGRPRPAVVPMAQRLALDTELVAVGGDPASVAELHRLRQREAIRQGQNPPPKAPKYVPQKRSPWNR